MSMTFKISVPQGELHEHLQGRDSRSRNFEIIRLATNALLGNIPNKMIHESIAKSNEDVEEEISGIRFNTKAVSEQLPTSDLTQVKIAEDHSIVEEIVDFGDELLNM